MQIDWWTLALQTINLLVLAWLLGRFLFRPVARIVRDRQQAVAQTLDDARAMREEAEKARGEAAQASAQIAAERERTLKSVEEEAEQERDRLVAEAREDASKLVEEAKREVARLQEATAEKNAKQASKLAVDIAARLFDRLPDESKILGFLDGFEKAIAGLPESVRGKIGEDRLPLKVIAARQLNDSETQACRKAVSNGLGREVEIAVTVDPDLIAGLELETPNTLVRNSFRADLDRIYETLTSDGEGDG